LSLQCSDIAQLAEHYTIPTTYLVFYKNIRDKKEENNWVECIGLSTGTEGCRFESCYIGKAGI